MIRPPDGDHFGILCRFGSRLWRPRGKRLRAAILSSGLVGGEISGRRRRRVDRDRVVDRDSLVALRNGAVDLGQRVSALRKVVSAVGSDTRALKDGLNIRRGGDSLGDRIKIRAEGVVILGKGAKLLWRCVGVRRALAVRRLAQRLGQNQIAGDRVFTGRWRMLASR